MPVKINVKTKIIFNGKEYSSPDELPPELRKAYDQALANRSASQQMQITTSSKVTFNGQTYNSADEMPAEARQFYDKMMEAVDKNHDGIPDTLETDDQSALPTTGTSTPMAPLPAQQSPIRADQPGRWTIIVSVLVILVLLLVTMLLLWLRRGG